MVRPPFPSLFERHAEYGPLFIRVLVGGHLIYMSHDNVVSWERMLEFERFLAQHGFPFPLVCAVVSVAAQFSAGICFVLGAATRWAAALMVVNFLAALVMVHTRTPYAVTFPALVMWAGAWFLLFHGPGLASVDAWMRRRSARPSTPVVGERAA